MPIARRACWRWPDCASDIRENPGRDFVRGWLTCGSALSSRPKPTGRCPTTNEGEAELLAAVARIIRVFGELGVDYLVGESIASSVFGEPRQTVDADLVACLLGPHAEPLAARLSGDFYTDLTSMKSAKMFRTFSRALEDAGLSGIGAG